LKADEGQRPSAVSCWIAVAQGFASVQARERLIGSPEQRAVGRHTAVFGNVERAARAGLRQAFVEQLRPADLGRHVALDESDRVGHRPHAALAADKDVLDVWRCELGGRQ
jgi:hypothetical protein